MSHNVIEVDEFSSTIPVTDVDDTTYPTTEADMGQRLANRTRFTHNTLTGNATFDALDFASTSSQLATQYLLPTTRLGQNNPITINVTRLVQSLKWVKQRVLGLKAGVQYVTCAPMGLSANWSIQNDAGVPWAQMGITGITSIIWVPLVGLPAAGTVTELHMWCKGVGVEENMPSGMPTLSLERHQGFPGVGSTSFGTATDATDNRTSYEAGHFVSLTGLAADLDLATIGGFAWYAKITGESGSNASADGFRVAYVSAKIQGAT